jgi:sugar phosphate isomerase/epimerase
MFVTVPDWILKYVPVEPLASLRALGLDRLDIGLDRRLCTPALFGRDGKPLDLSSAAGIGALGNLLAEKKVRACALSLATDFGRPDQQAEAQWLVEACRLAGKLGVPVIRIDPASWSAKLEDGEMLRRIAATVGRALDESEGVALGAENHGPVANREDFLDRMLERTPSERFGLTLDVGNLYWFGYPLDHVYELAERYAARVRFTHIKNIAYPAEKRRQQREIGWRYGELSCALPDGDIDLKRVVATLADAGYTGALAVEDESLARLTKEAAQSQLRRDVDHVKTLLR